MRNGSDYICFFPELDYNSSVEDLSVQGVSSAMISFVRERGGWFLDMDGIVTLSDLESDIRSLVAGYALDRSEDVLQDVFHKIQIWGGEHGRYIYVQGPPFDWDEIGPRYRRMVDSCLEEGRNADSLARKAKAMNTAMQVQGRRLGISFITKHVHFWTGPVRGENALPIFDNIMASGLRLRLKWDHLPVYWRAMEEKAYRLGISVDALERQLFNHFRNNPLIKSAARG